MTEPITTTEPIVAKRLKTDEPTQFKFKVLHHSPEQRPKQFYGIDWLVEVEGILTASGENLEVVLEKTEDDSRSDAVKS